MKIFGNSIITKTKVISVGDHETAGLAVKKSANLSLVNEAVVEEKAWKEFMISAAKANKKYYLSFKTSAPMWVRIQSCDGIQNIYHIMTVRSISNVPYSIPIMLRYDACIKICLDAVGAVSDICFATEQIPFVESDNITVPLSADYPLRACGDARDYFEIDEESVKYTKCADVVDGELVAIESPITTEVTDEALVGGLKSLLGEQNIESMNCVSIGAIEE